MARWFYFIHEYFELAYNARERSEEDEKEAIVAIFLSCAWAEALINEIIHQENALFEGISEVKKLIPSILIDLDLEKTNIKEKLNKVCLLLTQKKCPWGIEIFQDYNCLVKIRNQLMHSKPTVEEDGKIKQPNFLIYLINKKIITEPEEEQYFWAKIICDKQIATWSLQTVKNLIKYFVDNSDPHTLQIRFEEELEIIKKYSI